MKSHKLNLLCSLIAAGLLLAHVPASAQQSACVNYYSHDHDDDDDDEGHHQGSGHDKHDRQLCLQLTAQPDESVQASKLDGQNDTFVYYTARIISHTDKDYWKKAKATFTLTPAVPIVSLSSSTSGACSASGGTITCDYRDKHDPVADEVIQFTTTAPQYSTLTPTPSSLTATGTLEWKKRAGVVSKMLPVTTNGGGYTWVPPGQTVTMATAPEATHPSDQTSALNQVYAKVVLPGRSVGYLAYMGINTATDENLALSCAAIAGVPSGVFLSTGTSDGGPYFCRDIGPPNDMGIGTRWVELRVDDTVDGSFTDTPVKVTMIWDTSVISSAQQLAPTTDGFAIFFHAQEPQGSTADNPIRAFAKPCSSNAPPCISGLQKFGTGDWTATLQLAQVYDDSSASPVSTALRRLQQLVDTVLGVASATLPPPVIMK